MNNFNLITRSFDIPCPNTGLIWKFDTAYYFIASLIFTVNSVNDLLVIIKVIV